MADFKLFLAVVSCSLFYFVGSNDVLCEPGFCRTYRFEEGCAEPAIHCNVNNATHRGLRMRSPTICNCCDYCLVFYGEGEHCSTGGPGMGTTIGRCGDGLTCTADEDSWTTCTRMKSECHTAQDTYDDREEKGLIGSLEQRPHCDGRGMFAPYECIPAHTCFCQSEEGHRIFGEVLNLGAITTRNLECGCSRFHERLKQRISPGVPTPVVGPRCTSDGNFFPIQCIGRTCYCVNKQTGVIVDDSESIDLDTHPISDLPCYDRETDLFPQYSEGEPPYNFTTPCLEDMQEKIALILKSEEEGYNVDYHNTFPECLPDGTFTRIAMTRTGSKICIDERGHQIEDYESLPTSSDFDNMNCNCAQTANIMRTSPERPVCCKNGNFRTIQCRRGMCRCVDEYGRQTAQEQADVTKLECYTDDWRTC
nr:uncharacterized protein LOC110373801 [Helicoverpa armigera]